MKKRTRVVAMAGFILVLFFIVAGCGDEKNYNYYGTNPDPVVNSQPVITLLGDNSMQLNLGDVFTDPGATAYDAEDGDITGNIAISGEVNTSVAGTYIITYNVSDSEGLASDEATREVVVVETPPPEGVLLIVEDVTQQSTTPLVAGITGVVFTRIKLTAQENNITVSSIAVTFNGGPENDVGENAPDSVFRGIRLLDENGVQIWGILNFSESDTVRFGTDILVESGQSREFTVVGDVTYYLNGLTSEPVTPSIEVTSINANSAVWGHFPIKGIGHTTDTSRNLERVYLENIPMTNRSTNCNNYEFMRFRVTAVGGDVILKYLQVLNASFWFEPNRTIAYQISYLSPMVITDGIEFSDVLYQNSVSGAMTFRHPGDGIIIPNGHSVTIKYVAQNTCDYGNDSTMNASISFDQENLGIESAVSGYGIAPIFGPVGTNP